MNLRYAFSSLAFSSALVLFAGCNEVWAQSSGITYYVAPWGSNQNSGSSPQSPWQNIGFATAQMHAGDTLLVRGGIYSNQGFTIPTGVGTQNSPLRVAAYPGEAPILTGSETYGVTAEIDSAAIVDGLHFENFTNVQDVVDVWGSYVTIQNCTFKNEPFQFIRLMGADHVTIQNNYFDGNGQPQGDGLGDAIFVGSSTHVLIQNNYDTRPGHYFVDSTALSGQGPSSGVIVRDNTVESFWGGGIGHSAAHDLVYENNRLSHVGEGVTYIKASFAMAGASAIVRYNVMTNEAAWYSDNVLDILAEDIGGPQDALHNRVYNNVFYKNGYLPIFESQRWERDLSDNKIDNNILYYNETGGSAFYSPATTSYIGIETYHAYPECPTGAPNCSNYVWTQFPSNNYFQNNLILHADAFGDHPGAAQVNYTPNTAVAGWTISGFADTLGQAQGSYTPFFSGNIEQNPQFVDPDGGNFELQPSSPAFSSGVHLAYTISAGTLTIFIPVDDTYYFTDGYGMIPGDLILVGHNAPVSITSVNAANGTLTVSRPITFATGDAVDLADHNGGAPDMGAFPYSSSSPLLAAVSASVVNATTATITWATTGATVQVEYGLTAGYGETSLKNSSPETSNSLTLSGLWPSTTYHYAVISTDASGGRTISQDATFTTFAAPGPVISNVQVSGIATNSAIISWSTDEPASSQVFYSGPDLKYIWNPGYVNASPIADATAVPAHSVSITGLLPNTLYHFAVQSTDANGNTSYSPDSTFITQAAPSSGPLISGISINASAGPEGWFAGTPGQNFAPPGMNCCGYSYVQATFSWNTSKPATQNKVLLIPLVGGGYMQSVELDNSTAMAVAGNPEATTTPSLTVYQLAPNTTYVYMIQSTDANGNITTTPNYEFTTPSTAASESGASNIQAQERTSGLAGLSLQGLGVGGDGAAWGLDKQGDIFTYNLATQSWVQVPGSLSQITVGSEGSVWGINAAGAIYRWDPNAQTWNWISGSLSQLAVGVDGDMWGLNGQGEIYHFNVASQSWTQIPGLLAKLSVGFDGAVWGINHADQVYRFDPVTSRFGYVPGTLTQIAVGADGDVWGLNHESIYHFDRLTQGWDQVGGTVSQIAVGAGNNVWGLGSGGEIYQYDGQGQDWLSVPGNLNKIFAGGNGAAWGMGGSNNIYQFVGPAEAGPGWRQIPGALAQIATGMDGSIWGLNSAGQIYTFDPLTQGWTWIAGELSRIAVGTGNSVWGLNSAHEIYHYDPAAQGWRNVPGSLAAIEVGGNGDVWGLNAAGEIYRFDAATNGWTWIPGSLQQISVGADGAVWGINSAQQIYRFDPGAHSWIQTPGSLVQISVGSAENVWGINSQGSTYRLDAASQSWTYMPGANLTVIEAGFDGTVWGINSENQIFQFDGQSQSWIAVSGSLTQISVAADAVVWGLDANGSIYTYR